MKLQGFLEKLEEEKQKNFRKGHRMSIREFWKKCPNPQVVAYSYDRTIISGLRSRVDICRTCGRTNTTLDGVLHTGF